MGAATKIEWTDRTWNPIRGCSRISAGCVNCYAERQAIRHAGPGRPFDGLVRSTPSGPRWTGDVRLIESALLDPLSWRKPQRVFVNSMSDLFHESLPDEAIDRVFAVVAAARQHTFQVLTKRPERMRAYFGTHDQDHPTRRGRIVDQVGRLPERRVPRMFRSDAMAALDGWPLPNVWLGVSVEDQQRADERIPLLLQVPAAVRFLSVEPLLGPVDLMPWLDEEGYDAPGDGGEVRALPPVDWVIVGGESGPGARPCDVAWIRSVLRQCREAGVPCFVKQCGSYVEDRNDAGFDGDDAPTAWPEGTCTSLDVDEPIYQGEPVRVVLRNRKGGDPLEWPEDLRVREFPGGGA